MCRATSRMPVPGGAGRSWLATAKRRACASVRRMELTEFVLSQLDPPPRRVLEIGCGRGVLARALSERGYDMVAIDPEAPAGAIFRRTTIEAFDEPGPFGAVVASLSLHHVHELGGRRRLAATPA